MTEEIKTALRSGLAKISTSTVTKLVSNFEEITQQAKKTN